MTPVAPDPPQLTENKTVPSRTSSSTNIARRFRPTMTIPNMVNGRIEAKIGRGPCLSSPTDLVTPPALPAIVTVTVDDALAVPVMVNEDGDAEQLAPVGTVHVRVTG